MAGIKEIFGEPMFEEVNVWVRGFYLFRASMVHRPRPGGACGFAGNDLNCHSKNKKEKNVLLTYE